MLERTSEADPRWAGGLSSGCAPGACERGMPAHSRRTGHILETRGKRSQSLKGRTTEGIYGNFVSHLNIEQFQRGGASRARPGKNAGEDAEAH